MTRILCVGSIVLDMVFRLDVLPRHPEKLRADDARVVGGGCAASAAVAVARLGGESWLAGRVGDDVIGDIILSDLEAEGVNCSLIDRTAKGRSAFSSIYVDAAGERQIVSFRGESLSDSVAGIEAAPPLDAVLADTRWTPGGLAALRLARSRGVPGILDAEAPIAAALIEVASHVAFSRQGLASVAPGEDPSSALNALSPSFPGWACVTDGEHGVWIAGGGHVAAFPVDVADTLGAGDVWHGAFALRLAEGAGEVEAARFANAAAAIKCGRFGGREGCPDRAETEEFLERNDACN